MIPAKHLSPLLLAALLAIVSCQIIAGQQLTTNAKLLVDKEVLNKYIVEGRELVVNYHLINIGGSPARNVKVVDNTFPSDRFEIVDGFTKFTIPSIAPGTNVTHAAILKPRANSWGPHRFGVARVEYILNESGQLQVATTSELGDAYVVAARTFDRKFSSQFLDWFVFAILCLPSIVGPYYLWQQSDSKFSQAAVKPALSKKLN